MLSKLLKEYEELLRLDTFTSDAETEREIKRDIDKKEWQIAEYVVNANSVPIEGFKNIAMELIMLGARDKESLLNKMYTEILMEILSLTEEQEKEEELEDE